MSMILIDFAVHFTVFYGIFSSAVGNALVSEKQDQKNQKILTYFCIYVII